MAAYIAAVRLSGGTAHEHISQFVWIMEVTYKSGISTLEQMVQYVDGGNQVKVSDGVNTTVAKVIRAPGKIPYLQTSADGVLTDNLLSLPRF